MKYADIQKLKDEGLISDEQRQKIVDHLGLKEDGNKFLAIISMIGAVLVGAGIILLISSNWNEIPRGVKIAVGLLLMLGAHGFGWWLREINGKYRKTGEALHLIGSSLFLANIGLIGQIYNLSSRAPNAILLWWVGIAALPWLLKSKAQHILTLVTFGIWFGLEINQNDSLIFFGDDEYQILLYALLGLIYLGFGYVLRGTAFTNFARSTESLGLILFHVFAFPLILGIWGHHRSFGDNTSQFCNWIFPVMCGLALALVAVGIRSLKDLDRQWQLTWSFTIAGAVAMLAGFMYFTPDTRGYSGSWETSYHWVAALCLFVFSLLQIQVGLQKRAPFVVNLGIAAIAVDIITVYFQLIGTMARTGVMFIVSGALLIAFGVFLEKKRRKLMKQIKSPAAPAAA